MSAITLFETPPPEPIKSQILQMVVDYVTDISMVAIAPSNPLYNLYQYGIGYEVHLYLDAMDGSKGIPVELIVASDDQDPSAVVGFLLYLPVKDDPEACAVAYMAVLKSHRRQGIARAMLQEMVGRYPHAELACFVGREAYFYTTQESEISQCKSATYAFGLSQEIFSAQRMRKGCANATQ